jgi:hypothetical protein
MTRSAISAFALAAKRRLVLVHEIRTAHPHRTARHARRRHRNRRYRRMARAHPVREWRGPCSRLRHRPRPRKRSRLRRTCPHRPGRVLRKRSGRRHHRDPRRPARGARDRRRRRGPRDPRRKTRRPRHGRDAPHGRRRDQGGRHRHGSPRGTVRGRIGGPQDRHRPGHLRPGLRHLRPPPVRPGGGRALRRAVQHAQGSGHPRFRPRALAPSRGHHLRPRHGGPGGHPRRPRDGRPRRDHDHLRRRRHGQRRKRLDPALGLPVLHHARGLGRGWQQPAGGLRRKGLRVQRHVPAHPAPDRLRRGGGLSRANLRHQAVVHGRVQGALRTEVEHFLDCVRHNRAPLVGIEDALRAVALLEAAESALATGQPTTPDL